MATVKEIREERNTAPTQEKLKEHLKNYFSIMEKLTVGEDAAFRSELRSYSESLGMTAGQLNALCAECTPKT